VNLSRIFSATSDRHVEIMRDDLSEIFYDATRHDVEYLFGDSVTAISEDGEVAFGHGEGRRFDIVVGADGLHSNVRRLVFGEESGFTSFLGAYTAVLSMPDYLELDGRMLGYLGVGRLAGAYSATHMDDARALFLFRTERPLDYHHRDVPRQKELLRQAFAGMGGEVSRWLDELDRTAAFYFDSITQLRMDSWSRGRVSLVGDAGYCPGPVVGASTSLAVVGAYVLAGELAEADGDHERAFPAYEREMGDYVRRSRSFAVGVARWLVPSGPAQVWAIFLGARLLSRLPAGLTRAVARLNTRGVRLHDSVVLKDYSTRSGV
jgi:2-polyprenyl-6-methoxyphenol hydroxylase-like FAD-dependent oxidoreductase